jgi:hypothetical protein
LTTFEGKLLVFGGGLNGVQTGKGPESDILVWTRRIDDLM